MEEEKAAAYYEELTRKGEGAARFKQGLGFSSSPSTATNRRSVSPPSRGSALPSSSASSFLNAFVKASSPARAAKYEKDAQLESIQNKLKKRKDDSGRERERSPRVSRDRESSRRRSSRSIERDYRERESLRRRRSRSIERESSRRRRSRSIEREYRETKRSRSRRSRSRSPRREWRSGRRRSKSQSPDRTRKRQSEKGRSNGGVDYSKLIDGYDKLTPADRVKAMTKLQLDETAGKDKKKGMGAGWERFEFDKDAPLDDEEMEVVEDDGALVKHIGQSFRFSSLETKREEQINAAHDAAIFGGPGAITSVSPNAELEVANVKESNKTEVTNSLLSEMVIAKQQGSWRDRARKA